MTVHLAVGAEIIDDQVLEMGVWIFPGEMFQKADQSVLAHGRSQVVERCIIHDTFHPAAYAARLVFKSSRMKPNLAFGNKHSARLPYYRKTICLDFGWF